MMLLYEGRYVVKYGRWTFDSKVEHYEDILDFTTMRSCQFVTDFMDEDWPYVCKLNVADPWIWTSVALRQFEDGEQTQESLLSSH